VRQNEFGLIDYTLDTVEAVEQLLAFYSRCDIFSSQASSVAKNTETPPPDEYVAPSVGSGLYREAQSRKNEFGLYDSTVVEIQEYEVQDAEVVTTPEFIDSVVRTTDRNSAAGDSASLTSEGVLTEVQTQTTPGNKQNVTRTVTTPQKRLLQYQYTSRGYEYKVTTFYNHKLDEFTDLMDVLDPDKDNSISSARYNRYGLIDGQVLERYPADGDGEYEIFTNFGLSTTITSEVDAPGGGAKVFYEDTWWYDVRKGLGQHGGYVHFDGGHSMSTWQDIGTDGYKMRRFYRGVRKVYPYGTGSQTGWTPSIDRENPIGTPVVLFDAEDLSGTKQTYT